MPEKTIDSYSLQMWTEMDENEKVGVRFGLFPAERMSQAEKDGYDTHKISIALMNYADHNGV